MWLFTAGGASILQLQSTGPAYDGEVLYKKKEKLLKKRKKMLKKKQNPLHPVVFLQSLSYFCGQRSEESAHFQRGDEMMMSNV